MSISSVASIESETERANDIDLEAVATREIESAMPRLNSLLVVVESVTSTESSIKREVLIEIKSSAVIVSVIERDSAVDIESSNVSVSSSDREAAYSMMKESSILIELLAALDAKSILSVESDSVTVSDTVRVLLTSAIISSDKVRVSDADLVPQ
jgi:hypothetical protein